MKNNSVPLTSIIDANILMKTLHEWQGFNGCFIPHDIVIMRGEDAMQEECSWLEQLKDSDNKIMLSLLRAMKPSPAMVGIVE